MGCLTAAFNENPMIEKRFQYNQGYEMGKTNDRRHRPTLKSMKRFDKKIFKWIRKNKGQRFFLYIHYIDPHSPYFAPSSFRGIFSGKKIRRSSKRRTFPKDVDSEYRNEMEYIISSLFYKDLGHMIASYDEEIRYINSRFRSLVDHLKKLGLLNRTLVIFLSDHGEGFLEHGFLYHSYSVNAELVNMPLIIRCPGVFAPGKDNRLVQHIDIYPTILEALRISQDTLNLEGRSLLSEPRDLARNHKEVVEKLREYLVNWQKRIDKDRKKAVRKPMDKKHIKKLKSLGYIH